MTGKRLLVILWAAWLIFAVVGTGFAAAKASSSGEETPELPKQLTEDEIDAFLARMSDDQVRRLLLDQLKESARKEALDQSTSEDLLKQRADLFNQRLRQVLAAGQRQMATEMTQAYHRLTREEGLGGLFWILFKITMFLGFSFCAEWLVRRRQTALDKSLQTITAAKAPRRYGQALFKGVQGIIDLLVFFLAAFIIFQILYSRNDPGRSVAYNVFMATFIIRISVLVMDLVFSPSNRDVRLAGLSDESAVLIYHWGLAALILGTIAAYFSNLVVSLGVSPELGLFFRCFTGPLVALPLVGLAFQHSRLMIARLKAESDSGASEGLVRRIQLTWIGHAVFILYVLAGWGVSQYTMLLSGQGTMWRFLLSFIAIPLFIILDRLGQNAVGGILKPKTTDKDPAGESAAETAEIQAPVKLAGRALSCFLVILLVAGLVRFWNINLPWSNAVSGAAFSILITLVLAYLAWEYTKAAIERRLTPQKKEDTDNGQDGEGGGASGDRLFTLLPLFRKFIGVVLFVTVTLVVFSALGVHIGPFIASAGIFGLAIGLGAQTLVKDIVAGIFFLVDDAFRVGDYVSMGSVEGFVEKISLRTVTMRHHKGQVEVIPYGDIKTVTNFSRGPMLVKFNLFVPVDTDVKLVKKIVKKINQEMMEDEEFGPNLVDPIKSQGVKTIQDGVMTLRVKFRAQPGTQFLIKRQAFQRIQKAFKKAGIPFASRGVSVFSAPAPAEKTPDPPQGDGAVPPAAAPTTIDQAVMTAAAATILDSSGGKKK